MKRSRYAALFVLAAGCNDGTLVSRPYVELTLLLMRAFGLAFEERRLALDTPAFEQDIGALSPTRRVPVLHDDGGGAARAAGGACQSPGRRRGTSGGTRPPQHRTPRR